MRTVKTFEATSVNHLKSKLLSWSKQFTEICILDSNTHQDKFSRFELVLAAGEFTSIQTDAMNAFDDLEAYQKRSNDWIFGYLTYDLKNGLEPLRSQNKDRLGFPELYFFQPKKLIYLKNGRLIFEYLRMVDEDIEPDLDAIKNAKPLLNIEKLPTQELLQNLSRSEYLQKVNQLKDYIQRGDCYEANFCMEFYAESITIDPFQTFQKLNEISKAPFSAFFRNGTDYALCASPERYLAKAKAKIVSQPIKGTAKRGQTLEEDRKISRELEHHPKEIAENTMIVDLVRNDLSKTAKKASVNVENLCNLYSFSQVHQLISTVSSCLKEGLTPIDALKTTFPMGSMTGAPKFSVMRIIEQLESFKRGLYSGSIGYFSPQGDFDFNVVIRSILYNAQSHSLSAPVGGAITSNSIPEKEYDECLLKAKAMRQVLS